MARPRLPIAPHLPPDEIARRYRACRDGREKTHWQLLWLLTRSDHPPAPAEAAAQVGFTPSWARAILKRWNAEGPAGLADRRKVANGGKPKLTPEQQAELFATLQQPPPDGGLWTGPKLVAAVRDRYGVAICHQTGWGWLRRLGFTLQVPRPRHPEAATPAQQRAWKRRPGRADRRAPPRPPREGRRGLGRG
jgi:transposase